MLVVIILLLVEAQAGVQAETVFHGKPLVKIQENGVDRAVEKLSSEKAAGVECVISRIGNNYYWASRGNRLMKRFDSPGYIIYVGEEGVGYVKIVRPEVKPAVAGLKPTEAAFDYLEHMTLGLSALTYYGSARVLK